MDGTLPEPARPPTEDSLHSQYFGPGSTFHQWPHSPDDLSRHDTSPQSSNYRLDVAPLRWFGLLADDAANRGHQATSLDTLSDAALRHHSFQLGRQPERNLPNVQKALAPGSYSQYSQPIAPVQSLGSIADERACWQAKEPLILDEAEHASFSRFVKDVARWIDVLDPLRHFSSLIPHLALYNEGLMKAILALGARQNSIRPPESGGTDEDRTAAVQYYHETLQYLYTAMTFASYKNSLELLATVLVVSTYEMIDGAGDGWERHLKGVFWIQRSRNINGESGGLEQAIWWAWIRQDWWAAFRERRRCFSFFRPTKPYCAMSMWDVASYSTYLLARAVNYSSDEEKAAGEGNLNGRIANADAQLQALEEWRSNSSVYSNSLPVESRGTEIFEPVWIVPEAFGVALQFYSLARILLLLNKPSPGGFRDWVEREKAIAECIATIAGVAIELTENATRLLSTQFLFGAGLYCKEEVKRERIIELIHDHQQYTGWPCNTDLTQELRSEWSKQEGG
ncbi:hypothetical protein MBLNU230_g1129t1 [Neophaeotheca triangularis]